MKNATAARSKKKTSAKRNTGAAGKKSAVTKAAAAMANKRGSAAVTKVSARKGAGAVLIIKHFGAAQMVPIRGGYEMRIFRDQEEATALGVDPKIAAEMPKGGGCWNDWNVDGSFTCGGGCVAGCAFWVCEDNPSGGFTWVKHSGTKGTAADAKKGALCGCSDQP